jgi:hypothetical protein
MACCDPFFSLSPQARRNFSITFVGGLSSSRI